MLLTNKILPGQTMTDMALQELGDIERLFEIAVENDMSITEQLEIGSQLSIPVPAKDKYAIVQLFSPKPRRPASDEGAAELLAEGIDYWSIGVDFIVQ